MQNSLPQSSLRYNLEPNLRIYLSAVKKLKPVSIKNYLSDIRYFIGWFQQTQQTSYAELEKNFDLISSDIVQMYKDFLITNELPTRTVNRRLSSLRSLCAYLVSQGLIQANPSNSTPNYSEDDIFRPSLFSKELDLFKADLHKNGYSDENIQSIYGDVQEFLEISSHMNL